MFSWTRPVDMPPREPSEEAIWAAIDSHDPRGDVAISDRLEQYEEMLKGRDIHKGFFIRSPLLPDSSQASLPLDDPKDWITTIRLKCGVYNPLDKTVDNISHGLCDILQPAADILKEAGQSRLLSHRQLHSNSLEWSRDSSVGQAPRLPRGFVAWARYVLQVHKHTLQAAGVYEAVYISMFDYARIPHSWARGVIEFWDSDSNTCWVGPEEISITLWDLQTLSGLPVFGHPYEECIPPDEELFRRRPSGDGNRRGELILPLIYPDLLNHYHRTQTAAGLSTRSGSNIPVDIWIRSFLRDDYLFYQAASLNDPFNSGLSNDAPLSEETAEPTTLIGYSFPGISGIDEDLFLAGFIATWLCVFVLPVREGSVRSNTLLAASQISRGERLSLAPAVLARTYRVLNALSRDNTRDLTDLMLSWQYIYGWVHLHIQGAFSCLACPSYFLERGYPTIMQLSQASSTLEKERVRLFFFAPHLVADRFHLVHQPEVVGLPFDLREVEIIDGLNRRGRSTLLYSGRSLLIAEYFIAMRPGWLTYRFGRSVMFEGYQPNRVARQFGFSQATAYDGRPFIPGVVNARQMDTVPLETRFYAASTMWSYLLRLGTGSRFRLAAPYSHTGVSCLHLQWVRISFAASMEHGTNRYERRVRFLSIPRGQRPRRSTSQMDDSRG